ncbi:MAG: hypothetical protein HW387_1015 [Parachlamydiales bacterium]|nr:hypothetical protein [Parachlamydiales bacterium]
MKILFTGTSSFTGYWLIQKLIQQGHSVRAICQKSRNLYDGIRKTRLNKLEALCDIQYDCSFGSQPFIELIQSESSWDLFCHHAAETSDYKNCVFDYASALERNTHHLLAVLKLLQTRGCNRILLTGSVFEPGEGGSSDCRAVSPYGLSKGLTWQVFKYFAEICEMKLGKFVIPNPFGPYEDFRFTSYLIRSWIDGKIPMVNTPAYIRDNIHVDLLARNYCIWAESMGTNPGIEFCRPSGYVETQGEFTRRLAREMSERLSIDCPIELQAQTDFPEPLIRFNTDRPRLMEWSEEMAWDALAHFYRRIA